MRTAVIGLGNRDRGDDALGLVVIERLLELGVDADVIAWERPELDLLEVLHQYDRVMVVDAAHSGAPIGTLHDDPVLAPGSLGSHCFGLGGVLELAEALGRLPERVDVFLLEAGGWTHGAALSPAVVAATEVLVGRIIHELRTGDPDVHG